MIKPYNDALASYDHAITLKPNCAALYNNRGILLAKLRRFNDALANYNQAIALKPDCAEVYNNRGVVLQEIEQYDDALADYDKAIELKPDYANAHNNRGAILSKLRRCDSAVASCDQALTLKPDFAEAYNNRGVALHEMEHFDNALASYDQAIALKPDCAEAHNNRSATLRELKRYDDALASCAKAIALKPNYAEAYQNRGLSLVNKGNMNEAQEMFLEALKLKPDFPDAVFSLTHIRKYRDPDHADVKNIRSLLAKPRTSLRGRECLYFALGKIYDDCGLYDEAFECYRQANQIRNTAVAYNPDRVARYTDSIIDVFSKDFLAKRSGFSSDKQSPLFIVGMPRSGTTLLAQILSNHRCIASAGELPTILEFISRLPELGGKGIAYPRAVRHITPVIGTRLINDYEQRLRRDVGSDVPYVIDKHPLNFRHLGFISMLFPGARIIHCTRHPLDMVLSTYFQRFAYSYDYSFDLGNIAHFYGEYTRVMEHWRKVLPATPIEVSYEDIVMHTEQMVRKTLAALGLEWEERCLSPHTNSGGVETASQYQVRQPTPRQSVQPRLP